MTPGFFEAGWRTYLIEPLGHFIANHRALGDELLIQIGKIVRDVGRNPLFDDGAGENGHPVIDVPHLR